MKILIVEDNTSLKESLNEFFVNQGLESIMVSSYEEAFKLIKKEFFDLYVIDILLPDNKGYELLKYFNKESKSRFILMSGFFDTSSILKHIPDELQDLCFFMKKPIDLKKLLEQIQQIEEEEASENKEDDLPKELSPQSLQSFLSNSKTFDAQELISILFLAIKSKFSGDLEINLNNNQKHLIEFSDGCINKVIYKDSESYFGNLLVEHGLSLQEDIQEILEDKNSDQYLGEQLVNKALLSPHMLNFILKEQIKIRLTKIMSGLSFSINISEKKNEQEDLAVSIEFNEHDFIEWAIDSLKVKIKDSFLESFYLKNKYNSLRANSNPQQSIFNNKIFLEKYNNLFKKITNNITFEELLKNSKDSKDSRGTLELIYFGVLIKSIVIINSTETKEDNSKKSEEIINHILKDKTDNLFQILNVPWKASKEEVEKSFRELTKMIHPDKIPLNSSKKLETKYKEAFQKIQESYKILSSTKEREIYLRNQESESFLNILSTYEKGTTLIKSGEYKAGLNLLATIEHSNHVPDNSLIYMLWAKIQLAGNIYTNKEKAGRLKQEIEKCPIDQKVSPLFWFVSGLYYKNIHDYEKALTLFKKTLHLQKNFREAHQEIVLTKAKIKEELKKQNNNVLSRFFKKSS